MKKLFKAPLLLLVTSCPLAAQTELVLWHALEGCIADKFSEAV